MPYLLGLTCLLDLLACLTCLHVHPIPWQLTPVYMSIYSNARVGACELNADNQNTSLTHAFVFGALNASQHYEQRTSQTILNAAFTKLPNSYIQLATSIQEPLEVGL